MDLRASLAGLALRRVHVFIVEVPAWGRTRIAAEHALRRRGWVHSDSPADSDVLLICGTPGPELAEVIERVWDQLPGPRVRLNAGAPDQIPGLLARSKEALLDHAEHRRDALARTPEGLPPDSAYQDNEPHGGMDHEPDDGTDHGSDDGTDHGSDDTMGHGSEDGMGHGSEDGMDMPMPGGIGLAEGGPDRDGLDLDVLHVSLGPVLRHWPAGLVVHCSLQGDVITEASWDVLAGSLAEHAESPAHEAAGAIRGEGSGGEGLRPFCAEHCDHAATLLALLGCDGLSNRAVRVRDLVLEGVAVAEVVAELDRLAHRVGRSWLLRWSLKDVPGVFERLEALLEEARMALQSDTGGNHESERFTVGDASTRLHQLPGMITGLDLAAARLVIASLGLNTTAAVRDGSDRA